MGRRLRPYLPGGFFHLVSRLQDHIRYFDDALCERSIEIIGDVAARSDARIFALAIMPSHLHLVVQQGDRPLCALMQPIMRRIAHQVKRRHGTEGHAVERPYRAKACTSLTYLRDSIVYTHLNPRRAGLCNAIGEYPWTSHAEYVGVRASSRAITADAIVEGLSMFAGSEHESPVSWRDDYLAYVEWREACDRWNDAFDAGLPVGAKPICPSTEAGDTRWARAMVRADDVALPPARHRPDLRDVIASRLAALLPDVDLEILQRSRLPRALAYVRDQLIWSAVVSGYSGVEIARYLGISEATVSKVNRKHAAGLEARPDRDHGSGLE